MAEFPKGLMIKAPHDKAPDFVKGSISIKRAELADWLAGQNDEWINLDIKVSKGGKWYAQVNDWKPTGNRPQGTTEGLEPAFKPPVAPPQHNFGTEIDTDSIPFS